MATVARMWEVKAVNGLFWLMAQSGNEAIEKALQMGARYGDAPPQAGPVPPAISAPR